MPLGTSNLFIFQDNGSVATSWISALRTGCDVVGYEEPTWYTGYNRSAVNPHQPAFFTYLGSKNMKCARMLFCWESMQPTLLGALDSTYLAAVKLDVDRLLAQGIWVNLSPWQYGNAAGDTDITYRGSAFTSAQFADMWSKVASAFNYDDRISYGLITEPHTGGGAIVGITLANWFSYAQAAINSIRAAGSSQYIMVPGMDYASAGNWVSNGSAAAFIALTDTISPKRLIAECHNYGDNFPTTAGNNLTINIDAMVSHARTNGYKIFVGEIAKSSNPTTNPATADDVSKWAAWQSYCITNKDVIIAWCWWGADDNTVAGWGTDFYHWSLCASGSNNINSQWMDLIQSSLGEF